MIIVSDVRLYRDGLAKILRRDDRLQVLGVEKGAAQAVAAARRFRPHAILLDTGVRDAISAVQEVVAEVPEANVVAMGLAETETDVVAYAEAGIAGYVCREGSVEDVVGAVENAASERLLCSRRVAAALLRRVKSLSAKRAEASPGSPLTPRENQIVELLDRGLTNKDIASRRANLEARLAEHVPAAADAGIFFAS